MDIDDSVYIAMCMWHIEYIQLWATQNLEGFTYDVFFYLQNVEKRNALVGGTCSFPCPKIHVIKYTIPPEL